MLWLTCPIPDVAPTNSAVGLYANLVAALAALAAPKAATTIVHDIERWRGDNQQKTELGPGYVRVGERPTSCRGKVGSPD